MGTTIVTATAWWHSNNNTKPRGFSARPRGPLSPSTPVTLTKTSESSQPASTNEPCAASATTNDEGRLARSAGTQSSPPVRCTHKMAATNITNANMSSSSLNWMP